jgi:hypothetical protein
LYFFLISKFFFSDFFLFSSNKCQTSLGQMPAGVIELRKFALRLLEGKDREALSLSDSTGGSGGGGLVSGLGLSGSSGNNTLSRRRRHKFVFELWHPESRSYQLGVASALEREEWYFALRRFCQSSNS